MLNMYYILFLSSNTLSRCLFLFFVFYWFFLFVHRPRIMPVSVVFTMTYYVSTYFFFFLFSVLGKNVKQQLRLSMK